jgi:hypothetical protein
MHNVMIRYVVIYLFQTFRSPFSIVTSVNSRTVSFRFLAKRLYLIVSCGRAGSVSHPVLAGGSVPEGKAVET